MGCGGSKAVEAAAAPTAPPVPQAAPAPSQNFFAAPAAAPTPASPVAAAPVEPAKAPEPAAEVVIAAPSVSEEIKRLEPSLAAEDIIQEEVVTGVLWKKGESGTVGGSSWKQRFVVLAAGKLSYYTTQAAYDAGKPPIKGNRIDLRNYAVIRGSPESYAADKAGNGSAASRADPNLASSFYLEPLPVAGEEAGAAAARRWEFRSVEVADRDDWVGVFQEYGCVDEAEYAAAVARAAEAPATPAGGAGSSSAAGFVSPASPGGEDLGSTGGRAETDAERKARLAKAKDEAKAKKPAWLSSGAAALKAKIEEAAIPAPGSVTEPEKPPAVPLWGSAASSSAAAGGGSRDSAGPATPSRASQASVTSASGGAGLVSEGDDDSKDPYFKAGMLEKKGAAGTMGAKSWKARYVVLKGGVMSYYESEAARKKGAKPVKDSRVALGDYRVEKALDPQATGAPTTAAATVLKLVPTTGGVTRTYELRFPMAVAASLSNDVTMAELDAWHAAFTGQIAAAVAAGQGGSSFSTEYGSPSSAADV